MAHFGEEHNESSMRSFLVAPLALVTVGLVVWLAFTGFVVVPPGELAVVVTLVSAYDRHMNSYASFVIVLLIIVHCRDT